MIDKIFYYFLFGVKVLLVNMPNNRTASTLDPLRGRQLVVHCFQTSPTPVADTILVKLSYLFHFVSPSNLKSTYPSCCNRLYKEYTYPPQREAGGCKTVVKSLLFTPLASQTCWLPQIPVPQ